MRMISIFLLMNFIFLPAGSQTVSPEIHFSDHRFLPGYGFKKMRHPDYFQGNRKKKNYFEGWYFKMVSSDKSSILSVIPGISLSHNGKEQHAFIQVIDGKTARTSYYSFPIESLSFSEKAFAIHIGRNYFSPEKIILDIQTDSSIISGEVHMTRQVALPSSGILNPGIMGWYRFVPLMECYHGVVSLTHRLDGQVVKDGKVHNFDKGLGYIEKDWGSSMPSAWIWMQSNHFSQGNSSFMLSVANVPWLGKSFTGFLGFFLHDSTLYRFATYTHAKITVESIPPDKTNIIIRDRKNTYHIEASRTHAGLLKAPVKGSMDRRIPESIDGKILLKVMDRKGKMIFCDSTATAGLELVGDLKKKNP